LAGIRRCGSALLAAGFPETGIGFVGVSLAFGLTVLSIVYSLGHISGAQLNPAVTIGAYFCGRIKAAEILPHIVSQILGAIAAAGVLYIIVTGNGSPSAISLRTAMEIIPRANTA